MTLAVIETEAIEKQNQLLYQIAFDLKRIQSGDEYLKRAEVAKFIKVDVTTLDRWRVTPKYPSNPFPLAHTGGDEPRWLKSEIIEWMRRNGELAKGG